MVLKPICKEFLFSVTKIFEVLCPLCYASYGTHPIQSNYHTLSTEARMDIPRITLKEFKQRYILGYILIGFSNVAMWFNSVFTHAHYIE